MSTKKPQKRHGATGDKHISPRIAIPEFYLKYPGILEIFKQASEGAEFAQLPSITIFACSEGIRVCLCDRKRNRSLFRTGQMPGDALSAINEAIESGRADWRPKRSPRR